MFRRSSVDSTYDNAEEMINAADRIKTQRSSKPVAGAVASAFDARQGVTTGGQEVAFFKESELLERSV